MALHPPGAPHSHITPGLGCESQEQDRASPTAAPFGAALLVSGCRGLHQLPDKEVQEAKGKSSSSNVSGDVLCYVARVTLAKFVAMAELQPCMHQTGIYLPSKFFLAANKNMHRLKFRSYLN